MNEEQVRKIVREEINIMLKDLYDSMNSQRVPYHDCRGVDDDIRNGVVDTMVQTIDWMEHRE